MAIDGKILAAEIEAMIRNGHSIPAVAEHFRMSRWQIYKWARSKKIPIRGQPLTASKKNTVIRMVEIDGLSIKRAAVAAGVGRMQAWRLIQARREKELSEATEDLVPVQQKKPRRCPRHGLVTLWPCVACAAEGRRG